MEVSGSFTDVSERVHAIIALSDEPAAEEFTQTAIKAAQAAKNPAG